MNSPASSVSIDLVICTYNNAAMLERTLAAIARQQVSSAVRWQVLVVNNNCTDETPAVVAKYKPILPLRMVRERTQGLTPARLCGVQNTCAEWIAFVDDDCLLEPDWIEEAARAIQAYPDAGAFGSRVILEWEKAPPAFALNYTYVFAHQDHGDQPRQVGCLAGAGIVIRRGALASCGWIDKQFLADRVGNKLISGGDVEIALRLASHYPLWYNPALRLRHLIPARRTTPGYLKAINYGLGSSQLMGDTMLWGGTYRHWVVFSMVKAARRGLGLVPPALRVLLGRKAAIELAIDLQFLAGGLAGLWRLLRMDVQERRQLLGCARVRNSQ